MAGCSAEAGLPPRSPIDRWLDRLLALRDRWLASPRFQYRATALWLTRPIARRRSRALFDLCAGFVYSQVLLACVRLELFAILAEGPQSLEALARRLAMPPEAARRLLRAAVALRLVERRRGERYGLGVLGAALLGNPGIGAMIEHHALLYGDLQDPVALLRGERSDTRLGGYWPYAGSRQAEGLTPEGVAAYTRLMAASQPLIAAEVLDGYPLARHRCLLDVGGGDGTFLTTVAARLPHLELELFDLPAVAERARARLRQQGLADRARAFGGDLFHDPLPRGADVITLLRIVHDHDDPAALAILQAVRRALPPDGVLLLAEPMADTPGAEPMGDAYFGFYLLAMGSGRPRTLAELRALLETAGFEGIRPLATRNPLLTRLLLARPSSKLDKI